MNKLKRFSWPGMIIILVTLVHPGWTGAEEILKVGDFSHAAVSSDRLPENWEPLTFKNIDKHTKYEVVEEDGMTVIRAGCRASASGLIRKIHIDPRKYPVIQWRWKITGVYKRGDVTRKSGDDYPARIYIAFEYDPDRVGFLEKAKFETARILYGEYPPIGAINYIWGSRAPVGTRVPNPYTGRVMMIVVESGPGKTGTWVTEERNIYRDYVDSFGQPPPMISGVAIMTDADNTGEATTSFYGDIVFKTDTPSDRP
jgi:hypothetical protein